MIQAIETQIVNLVNYAIEMVISFKPVNGSAGKMLRKNGICVLEKMKPSFAVAAVGRENRNGNDKMGRAAGQKFRGR